MEPVDPIVVMAAYSLFVSERTGIVLIILILIVLLLLRLLLLIVIIGLLLVSLLRTSAGFWIKWPVIVHVIEIGITHSLAAAAACKH